MRTEISYTLDFNWADDATPGSGFGFPCDEHGNVQPLQPAGRLNYERCVANTHVTPVVCRGVRRSVHRYREPSVLQCPCGVPLALHDALTNECDCGRFYNGGGQELCHPRLWGEDTGERFDEHGHPIL